MMKMNRKTLTTSLGPFLLAAGLATNAWGQAGVAGGAAAPVTGAGNLARGGAEVETELIAKGKVICTDCTLEEVRKAQPQVTDLYQLTRATPGAGRIVMEINEVNNRHWWQTVVGLSHEFPVRAEERVWQGLTSEENLLKDVEILGILRRSRTLELNEVKIGDMTLSERENVRLHRQIVAAGLRARTAATRAETAALQAESAALRAETVAEQIHRTVRRIEAM